MLKIIVLKFKSVIIRDSAGKQYNLLKFVEVEKQLVDGIKLYIYMYIYTYIYVYIYTHIHCSCP